MDNRRLLDLFSELLSYPQEGYLGLIEVCRPLAAELDMESANHLACFGEQLNGQNTDELQELFVRTFDLNPICALEVGWQLFGDNYDRGDFLVRMQEELGRCRVERSTELPDHLCHMLRLLGRMEPDRAHELATTAVLPGLKKMLAGLEEKQSPYERVLKAVVGVLEVLHAAPLRSAPQPQAKADSLCPLSLPTVNTEHTEPLSEPLC